jgi:hypothetical protein
MSRLLALRSHGGIQVSLATRVAAPPAIGCAYPEVFSRAPMPGVDL